MSIPLFQRLALPVPSGPQACRKRADRCRAITQGAGFFTRSELLADRLRRVLGINGTENRVKVTRVLQANFPFADHSPGTRAWHFGGSGVIRPSGCRPGFAVTSRLAGSNSVIGQYL